MTRKQMTYMIIFLTILLAVAEFFIVSVCLAQQHGVQLIQEWKNWFGIKEQIEDSATIIINIAKSLRI